MVLRDEPSQQPSGQPDRDLHDRRWHDDDHWRITLRSRHNDDQAGLATTEVAILFPIVIAIILIVVQGALWAHAGAVAQAAADHGAEVAALLGSSDAAGVAAAEDFAFNAGTIVDPVAVGANAPGSEFVEITVNGRYPSLFGNRSISATSVTVREQVPTP